MISPGGKECLLSIYTAGDFLGKSCLADGERLETAVAMTDTVLKQVAANHFMVLLAESRLLLDFVRHMATRLAEHRQMITNLATVDCEIPVGRGAVAARAQTGGLRDAQVVAEDFAPGTFADRGDDAAADVLKFPVVQSWTSNCDRLGLS